LTALRDGKPYSIPGPRFLSKWLYDKLEGTSIGQVLAAEGLIPTLNGKEIHVVDPDAGKDEETNGHI
jgi:hypothetical protein